MTERFVLGFDSHALATFFFLKDDLPEDQAIDTEVYWKRASNFIEAVHAAQSAIYKLNELAATDEEVMFHFYEVGKKFYGEKNLRAFFRDFYLVLFDREDGSRLGVLTRLFGFRNTFNRIYVRLENPLKINKQA